MAEPIIKQYILEAYQHSFLAPKILAKLCGHPRQWPNTRGVEKKLRFSISISLYRENNIRQ